MDVRRQSYHGEGHRAGRSGRNLDDRSGCGCEVRFGSVHGPYRQRHSSRSRDVSPIWFTSVLDTETIWQDESIPSPGATGARVADWNSIEFSTPVAGSVMA